MLAVPTEQLVRLWEQGLGLPPLARTLLLAQAAQPDLDSDAAEQLGLGACDALLYDLREQLFGTALPLYSICPVCRIDLELHLNIADVRAPNAPPGAVYTWELGGSSVVYRMPCVADLLALQNRLKSGAGTQGRDAETELLLRCLISARSGESEIDPRTLPAAVLEAVAGEMADKDPQAEVLFNLNCPGCQQVTETVLDIGSYVWAELDVAVRRLLLDVHKLANAYGWSESQVLKLSSVRRQFYIDAIEAGA